MEFSPVYWLSNGSLVPSALGDREKTSASGVESPTPPIADATTLGSSVTSDNDLPLAVQIQDVGPILSGPDSLENSLLNAPVSNEIVEEQPGNLAENHEKPLLASIGMIGSAENAASSDRYFSTLELTIILSILHLMQRRSHHL